MQEPLDAEALASEVAASNFDDRRLRQRLEGIVRRASTMPEQSLPRIFPNSAELEGAYRFFSNPRVTPDEILSSHVAATAARAVSTSRVLVVHDTTDFSYRVDGQRQGLGRAIKSTQTFFGHFSLVLAGDGSRKPLGVAAFLPWVRGPERSGVEHARWLAQVEDTTAKLERCSHVIHVMDREADDYAMFSAMVETGRHFIVRSATNRWTKDCEGKRKLYDALATIECEVVRDAKLTRRRQERSPVKARIHPARAPRVARLSVAATRVSFVRPVGYGKGKKAHLNGPKLLELNVVRVWEPAPPVGASPIEWILLTNEPVSTAQQMLDVVDHYRARWTIEEYFKALKTGCSAERRQLQDYESLINLIATFAPIAYQALRLRTQARVEPDAPASTVVTQDELEVLRALGPRKLPDVPTARDVLLAIAGLGGHIQYAPDPGWQTISRGYVQLEAMTRGWVAAKFQQGCDQR